MRHRVRDNGGKLLLYLLGSYFSTFSIGFLFGKRLDTIFLRHWIRKYLDSVRSNVIGFLADLFFSL